MQRSRTWSWMLAVCGVALVSRIALLWWQGALLNQDVDAYLEIARHVADGDGFIKDQPPHVTAYRPPLYPLLIAPLLKWCGGPFAVGIMQAMLGVLTTALTLRIGIQIGLGWTSLVAGMLVAVDPLLLQYTTLPMTETLCGALVTLWCWLTIEYPADESPTDRVRFWTPFWQGMCLGLLCLCRPAFLAAAGLIGLGLVRRATSGKRFTSDAELIDRSSGTRTSSDPGLAAATTPEMSTQALNVNPTAVRAILLPLPWLLGLIAILSPWMIRNALAIGKATPATTHGGYTMLLANNPVFYREVVSQPWGTVWQGPSLDRWQRHIESQIAESGIKASDEVARDRWMYRQAWSNITAQPNLFLRACLWRGVRFWDIAPFRHAQQETRILIWAIEIFYGLITVGILIGLFRLSRLEWKTWSWLLLLPLTLWLTHLVYWTDMRMRAPVIPILALLVARGLHLTGKSIVSQT